MLSTCKGWDTQTSRKLGLIFWNWGVICLICLELLWQCVGRGFWKGFLHDIRDWLGGERVCVSHYMKDNVHEHLEIHCPAHKTTCLLFESRSPIQEANLRHRRAICHMGGLVITE